MDKAYTRNQKVNNYAIMFICRVLLIYR